ncbi:hypothetical protein RHGRI_032578 [Rhododendron griersonianum]|uniref:Uncharacterized protein n=1 Tax=Rhododendron griersonianum TaxID=479676 RepID=A0AAV6ICI2_9ERIC|nr:hypothetical protein RHGRI_032578 [Rhododendron griersonianum]
MPFGRSGVLLPDDAAALTCSKKRTWTTVRNGSLSFWTACIQASTDSFLQSMSLHILFLSLLLTPGCSCRNTPMNVRLLCKKVKVVTIKKSK